MTDPLKLPCESCGHMTTLRCSLCGRALCSVHAAWNRDTQTHPGGIDGALPCPRPRSR